MTAIVAFASAPDGCFGWDVLVLEQYAGPIMCLWASYINISYQNNLKSSLYLLLDKQTLNTQRLPQDSKLPQLATLVKASITNGGLPKRF